MHDMSHSCVRAQSICTTRLDAYLKCVQIFFEGSLQIRDMSCKYDSRHTHLIHVIAVQIIGLFCKRALQKRLYSTTETYDSRHTHLIHVIADGHGVAVRRTRRSRTLS